MDSQKGDGGRAFPCEAADGMSMLDYFAAHAPEMPEWWLKRFGDEEREKAKKKDTYQMRGVFDAMIEWRWTYAALMVSAGQR